MKYKTETKIGSKPHSAWQCITAMQIKMQNAASRPLALAAPANASLPLVLHAIARAHGRLTTIRRCLQIDADAMLPRANPLYSFK
jgi:hypothetical protein